MSFYWGEGDDAHGTVPAAMTTQVGNLRRAMKGTVTATPKCEALTGVIGSETACSIYALRPSPCRDFTASWEHGVVNEACDRARARHGLRPLVPEDWDDDPELPEPLWPKRAA